MILLVSGSTNSESTNRRLLDAIKRHFITYEFSLSLELSLLPLFRVEDDNKRHSEIVLKWREQVAASKAIIISSPAYLKNIPAALKNAFEWLKSSGEMAHKAVFVITFTPHSPRGAEALQSIIWSLQALEARIVGKCQLYQTDLVLDHSGRLNGAVAIEWIEEALKMLTA